MSSNDISKIAGLRAELQAVLQKAVEAGVPGMSGVIACKLGVLWQGCAGRADLLGNVPITEKHIFGIGSITKVFVSTITLEMVEEERIALDKTVGDYLDASVTQGILNAPQATISSLMSHTSGIVSWEDDPKWIREGRGVDVDPARIWGLIIQKVTGNKIEDEIRRRIFRRLRMTSTYLEGFEPVTHWPLPHRYHYATPLFRNTAGISPHFSEIRPGLIDATSSNLSVEWAAGGMATTAYDLSLFLQALRGGRLVSPAGMTLMNTWLPVGEKVQVSHGLFRTETDGGYLIGHNGSVLGFTGCAWWAEEEDCVATLLANVGSVHAGPVLAAGSIGMGGRFVTLALELSKEWRMKAASSSEES
ncbi:MAG: hypothetical protein M1818_003909 [Claussenomyces sp. TS43310]|nr:MAG: hypothetical protein M1818_003909 [Claussenomyces sp. TS43310]